MEFLFPGEQGHPTSFPPQLWRLEALSLDPPGRAYAREAGDVEM